MAQPAAPAPALLIRCGSFFFRYRNLVFPAFLVLFVLAVRPRHWTGKALDDLLDVAGLAAAVLGQSFRGFVIGLAYIKRGGLNKQVYAESLVTEGMFSACRNPLYLGNALILTGLLLILNDPVGYIVGGAFFGFAYWSIIRTEETYLVAKFGTAYADYCRAVPRWWPRLRRLSAATRGASFNWRRVVMKDYGTLAAWMASAIALKTYEQAVANLGDIGATAARSAGLMATVIAGALLIRTAKKTGLLTDRENSRTGVAR
jgi:protein-S-isoprenylcysteine O-methyltransferase Ste14